MKSQYSIVLFIGIFVASIFLVACGERDDDDTGEMPLGGEMDFVSLLTNQVDEVIIPSMMDYQTSMNSLDNVANHFLDNISEQNLNALRFAYKNAYLKYQAVAVHNYFATANQALVTNTNLYPVDANILAELISTRSYDFSTTAQQRANGFPALDIMLYGFEDTLNYFQEDSNRIDFLMALVESMLDKADTLVDQWTGELRDNFISNGGTGLGSSVSVQLNDHLSYYEEHIRENKVGIPIGRLGPNDDPIAADENKIEALHESNAVGEEIFTLQLLRSSIEEMEDLYLGRTTDGSNNQGYDDLLFSVSQTGLDEDIKAQFQLIYELIDTRNTISGDESLYNAIQGIVTLYKSDMFPVLNVQDADGANDGD